MKYPSLELISGLDFENVSQVDGVMELILKCIDGIFDNDNVYDLKNESEDEIKSFIESLNNEQFRKVQSFFLEIPAVDYKRSYDCKCGKTQEVELRGLNSFFT